MMKDDGETSARVSRASTRHATSRDLYLDEDEEEQQRVKKHARSESTAFQFSSSLYITPQGSPTRIFTPRHVLKPHSTSTSSASRSHVDSKKNYHHRNTSIASSASSTAAFFVFQAGPFQELPASTVARVQEVSRHFSPAMFGVNNNSGPQAQAGPDLEEIQTEVRVSVNLLDSLG